MDSFFFLGLQIKKCPGCTSIIHGQTLQCEFLQLDIKEEKNYINELIDDYFAEQFPEEEYECGICGKISLISSTFYCLNAPNYLIMEFEDKNKVIFKDEIIIPLYDGREVKYKFIGAIYKKKVENHSEFYAINKEKNKEGNEDIIIIYDNDDIKESKNYSLINSDNPSMAIYQGITED